MMPSIGRIVLFQGATSLSTGEPAPFPAIVTRVHSETMIDLQLFGDHSFETDQVFDVVLGVPADGDVDPAAGPGFWYWPPRLEVAR